MYRLLEVLVAVRMRMDFRMFFCVLCVNCCVVCDSKEQRHAGGFRALPIVEVSCIISLHLVFDLYVFYKAIALSKSFYFIFFFYFTAYSKHIL